MSHRLAGRPSFVPQILIALAGSLTIFTVLTLPPKAARLPPIQASRPTVFGAYHVHSDRSDGTGTPDDIAAAAARAGLQFVILTDHGDGTRSPDPPQYRHGVLCVDALEVNTAAGHVVALGLDRASPFPLAGEARDVVDDIHRFGGWAVIAHPDSPKEDLRWRAWNVPYDGLEWVNVDSEWRDETPIHLAATLASYVFRSPETIASLFQRPARTLQRWDMTTRQRPVVALAALDAHARGLGWNDADVSKGTHTLLARPTYQEMFRTLTQGVILSRPFSGTADQDQVTLLDALRHGQAFSVTNAIASPAFLAFSAATQSGVMIGMGQRLDAVGSPVTLHASIAGAPTARIAVLHNGREIATARGSVSYSGVLTTGAYRVEAFYPTSTFPWVVSNPIYAGADADAAPDTTSTPPTALRFISLPASGQWDIENESSSSGALLTNGAETQFSFTLGPGIPAGQFAAVTTTLDPSLKQDGFDRVRFTVRADRPMRVSVQLRLPGTGDARRWRQSIYVDQTPRTLVLYLQDFLPVGATTSQRPIVAHLQSVLFVVDTLNTSPAARGTLWLSGVALGVGNPER